MSNEMIGGAARTALPPIARAIVTCSTSCKWAAQNVATLVGGTYVEQGPGVRLADRFAAPELGLVYLSGWYVDNKDREQTYWQFLDGLGRVPKLVHWAGTDILMAGRYVQTDTGRAMARRLREPDVVHWTECEESQVEVQRALGFDSTVVTLPPLLLHPIVPYPPRFTVGVYMYSRRTFYMEHVIHAVAKLMPDVDFLVFGRHEPHRLGNLTYAGWFPRISDVIRRTSTLLRLTEHDSMPQGPMEWTLSGRYVVCNFRMPHVLHVLPIPGDVCARLRDVQTRVTAGRYNVEGSRAYRVRLGHVEFRARIEHLRDMSLEMSKYWVARAPSWLNTHTQSAEQSIAPAILARIRAILALAGAYGSVVDLGCGTGRWRPELTRGAYLGVDVAPQLVEYAKGRWREQPETRFEVCDLGGEALPFSEVDLGFSYTSLMCLPPTRYRLLLAELIEKVTKNLVLVETTGKGARGAPHVFEHVLWDDLDVRVLEWLQDGEIVAVLANPRPAPRPRVSVVMTAWNRAAYLSDAVASVFSQTYSDWELVIVDDASTDETWGACLRARAEQPGRVRVARLHTRTGPGAARNVGNRLARGEILVVHDSDDISLPERLARTVELFDRRPEVNLVHGSYIRADSRLKPTGTVRALRQELGDMKRRQGIGHPTVAYRAEAIRQVEYPPDRVDVDYTMLVRFAERFPSFGIIDDPIVVYRVHQNSISVGEHAAQRAHAEAVRRSLLP